MTLNLPSKVRLGVYVFFGVGSIAITYLRAANIVGDNEVTAWVALTVFGNGLAALNVDTSK